MKTIADFLFILLPGLLLLSGCESRADEHRSMAHDVQDDGIHFDGDFEGPLGLQLWSLREYARDDVRGTLQRAHDMGFREVELAGTYGLSPADFRRMLDDVGLEATAMHAPYERLRDSIDVVLDEAEALGVSYVGVAWIPHEGTFGDANARAAASDFNRIGEAASQRGLTFFYHVHGYEFRPDDSGRTPFDELAEATDAENVKFEMDVFWTALPGVDPAEMLRKHPDRWELMHVKDMQKGYPLGDHSGSAPEEADVPVGTGQIDYVAVLRAAREIGLDRYYIEDESPDPLSNIPQSIDYLRTIRFSE